MENDYSIVKENIFNAEFENFCRKSLFDKIYKLEKTRKIYLLTLTILLVFLIILVIYCFFIKNIPLAIAGLFLFFAVSFYILADEKLSKKTISTVLSYIGNFKPVNCKENDKELANTIELELFNFGENINVFVVEFNSIKGTYNNKQTLIEEICFAKEQDGEESGDIFFNGIMVKVPCSKAFSGKTIIKNKAYNINVKKEKIDINNEYFSSLFDVYSDNPSQVQYLINDTFINLMIELGKENIISVSFENGNIYAALSKKTIEFKDLSYVNKFSSIIDFENYKRYLYIVNVLIKITDSINDI